MGGRHLISGGADCKQSDFNQLECNQMISDGADCNQSDCNQSDCNQSDGADVQNQSNCNQPRSDGVGEGGQ